MTPLLYSEITCVTSPVLGTPFFNDLPRIACVGVPITGLVYDHEGKEPVEPSPYLRVRELDLIRDYPKYDIRVAPHSNQHFIRLRDSGILDPEEFHNSAKPEIARINRVLGAIYPTASEIVLSKTVYISERPGDIRDHWIEGSPILTSAKFPIVDNSEIVAEWNNFLLEVLKNREAIVFRLFELENSNSVVASCVALISQNTYPAFYNAYEAIVKEYGGKPGFLKTHSSYKKIMSRFTENAQVTRHTGRVINSNTEVMILEEAKLFIIGLLRIYIRDRCPDR